MAYALIRVQKKNNQKKYIKGVKYNLLPTSIFLLHVFFAQKIKIQQPVVNQIKITFAMGEVSNALLNFLFYITIE